MRELYLGDSYDLIKRFWSESLRSIAPLYAHPRFVPSGIRTQYAQVTGISVFDAPPLGPFGILLDPPTGIPLPSESANGATASHASQSKSFCSSTDSSPSTTFLMRRIHGELKKAGYRDFRANRLTHAENDSATALPNLEDVSQEPL